MGLCPLAKQMERKKHLKVTLESKVFTHKSDQEAGDENLLPSCTAGPIVFSMADPRAGPPVGFCFVVTRRRAFNLQSPLLRHEWIGRIAMATIVIASSVAHPPCQKSIHPFVCGFPLPH